MTHKYLNASARVSVWTCLAALGCGDTASTGSPSPSGGPSGDSVPNGVPIGGGGAVQTPGGGGSPAGGGAPAAPQGGTPATPPGGDGIPAVQPPGGEPVAPPVVPPPPAVPATGGSTPVAPAAGGSMAMGGNPGLMPAGGSPGATAGGAATPPLAGGAPASPPGKLGVTPVAPLKPRVIATTDGELDDTSSMNRFLAYASDYEIVGIVQVNSSFQKSGHSKDKWIEEQIAAYAECVPNLRKHRPDYPSAEHLLSVLTVGNEVSGDLGKSPDEISDNPGAQLIIKTLLDDDPRPVHILAWGGTNTQANALWQIKNDPKYTPADYEKAVSKAMLYCIWFQDAGGGWITKNLPEIKIYGAGTPGRSDDSWRYVWDYMSVTGKYKGRTSQNPPELQEIMDTPWLMANVKKDHGPLGAAYTQDYTSEGDTPSFMPLIDNGLDQASDYTLGGWGGRPYYDSGGYMKDSADELDGKDDAHWTFQRWLPAAQNDWASRSDWCVADSYEAANHQPDARVSGPLLRKVAAGSVAMLDASPTTDPDGDEVTYKWWQYHEADSAEAKVEIAGADTKAASFTVPAEAGKQVQIVLEVVDQGTPPLTRYQRILYDIE